MERTPEREGPSPRNATPRRRRPPLSPPALAPAPLSTFPPWQNGQNTVSRSTRDLEHAAAAIPPISSWRRLRACTSTSSTRSRYSDSVDVEEGRGASPPMGTTAGQYKNDGSISVTAGDARGRSCRSSSASAPTVRRSTTPCSTCKRSGSIDPRRRSCNRRLHRRALRLPPDVRWHSGSTGPGVMVVKYAMNVQLIRHNGRLPPRRSPAVARVARASPRRRRLTPRLRALRCAGGST